MTDEPTRGRDTATGTDPNARYDHPGYEDKSFGQGESDGDRRYDDGHTVFRAGPERVEVTGEAAPRAPYGPESGKMTDHEPADDPNRSAPDAAGMSAGGPDGQPLRDSDAAPTQDGA